MILQLKKQPSQGVSPVCTQTDFPQAETVGELHWWGVGLENAVEAALDLQAAGPSPWLKSTKRKVIFTISQLTSTWSSSAVYELFSSQLI